MKIFWSIVYALMLTTSLFAQQQPSVTPDPPSEPVSDSPQSFFPHLIANRFWISGQANAIFQGHGTFESPYQGMNSLLPTPEAALSEVLTLYTGVRLTNTTDFLFDVENTGGHGISNALGIAGFTNLDVVRNPTLGYTPYVARIMLHQIVPLSKGTVETQASPLSLQTLLPKRRLEIRAGKFGTADFFDLNSVGSDSHYQFENWTIDNNGAYDYAADTRGYTYGVIVEYQQPNFAARFGEMLMPKVANGINLDWNLRRARAENLELEFRPTLWKTHATTIRPLAYLNHANMGDYKEAINAFIAGTDAIPDITLHRHQGTLKQGFGLNIDQDLPGGFRCFLRWGWNEGRHESYAYTEVNSTVAFGLDVSGRRWGRRTDRLGSAFVSNGISKDHQEYLALGGLGFLLGDGHLNYGHEQISETYYTAHLWHGVFASADLQFINNPGYNRDRGPVLVPGTRLHVEF